jgi:hypothetical protein
MPVRTRMASASDFTNENDEAAFLPPPLDPVQSLLTLYTR